MADNNLFISQADLDVLELESEFIGKVTKAYSEYTEKYNRLDDIEKLNRMHGTLKNDISDKFDVSVLLDNYNQSAGLGPDKRPLVMLLDPANDDCYYDDGKIINIFIITHDEADELSRLAENKLEKLALYNVNVNIKTAERLLSIADGKFPIFVSIRD